MPDPTPPRPPTPGGRSAVLIGVAAVVAGVLLFVLVANVSGSRSGGAAKGVGTDLFVVGQAKGLDQEVDRDGPLLLQDLRDGSRDIYVQHLGGDDWRAFEAHAPGAPRRCVLRWERAGRRFTDPCGGASYPADGTGLVSFPTRVDAKGRVVVDLRHPVPPAATTAPTSTGASTA